MQTNYLVVFLLLLTACGQKLELVNEERKMGLDQQEANWILHDSILQRLISESRKDSILISQRTSFVFSGYFDSMRVKAWTNERILFSEIIKSNHSIGRSDFYFAIPKSDSIKRVLIKVGDFKPISVDSVCQFNYVEIIVGANDLIIDKKDTLAVVQ